MGQREPLKQKLFQQHDKTYQRRRSTDSAAVIAKGFPHPAATSVGRAAAGLPWHREGAVRTQVVTLSSEKDNTKTNTAWNGPHRLCPHSLSHRSSSSTAAPAPRGHHKPERIGHYELLPRRLGNPTTGACPCRSARTRATPAAAAPARQRASKRHAGWLSRVWAVLRGTVRRGTQPRPHTHTHAHSYQPVCIINTYYLTYPTPHTRDARLGRR